MTGVTSGHRPASFPSPPRSNYELGALAAREFLLDKQLTLARYRLFRPSELREVLENDVGEQCKEYRAGFLDAIGAYICLTLEGSQPDPANWNPLSVIRARRL
ncbi:hypothetical protein [Ralstonia sp. UBA689]|uniref:hypothetical protein n=1 Tax=Ralstonia sp. UBA689 TaxID=1947373 RepID=UPI0025E547FF|nr:hypothetical protein [Ralstonia sp. UBA689]